MILDYFVREFYRAMNVTLVVWLFLCSVLVICGARQIPEKSHHHRDAKRAPETTQSDDVDDTEVQSAEDGKSSFEEYPVVFGIGINLCF